MKRTVGIPLTCKEITIGITLIPFIVFLVGFHIGNGIMVIFGGVLSFVCVVGLVIWGLIYLDEHFNFKCRCEN